MLTAVLATVIATLAVAAWIIWKLNRTVVPEEVDAGWWKHFSADKYAPLAHLLDGSEFAFLERQCGCDRRMLRRFRARRARIAGKFLNEMRADFERLQAVGQALVVAGRCAEGFQDELFRHRVRFTRAWWRVRAEVLLWQLGLGGVNAERLLESMRVSAASVQSAFAPAA
jgi:hypothetical protein